MKKYLYIAFVSILLLSNGCIDRTVLDEKPGVTIPPVSDLAVTVDPENSNRVILTWTNPTTIPSELKQPIGIYIEVYGRKTTDYGLSNPRLVSYDSYNATTMPPTPSTYTYTLSSSYQIFIFVVSTHSETVSTDTNYETNIYSLGQSVSYTKP
jgi:hypothetical protein